MSVITREITLRPENVTADELRWLEDAEFTTDGALKDTLQLIVDRIRAGESVLVLLHSTFPTKSVEKEVWHSGRSFSGTRLEDECPCEKAPCGLVMSDFVNECPEHGMQYAKSIRQSHRASDCPGISLAKDSLQNL